MIGVAAQDRPGGLLGRALGEAGDHVLQPLGQGGVPERRIHGPKPLTQMIAIQVAETGCVGFSDSAG